MTMWCNSCGAELQQDSSAAITACKCGSTTRQSWKPHPNVWWGNSGGTPGFKFYPEGGTNG